MSPDARTEDIYEERVARYLDLAEAAQEASGRAASLALQETYAHLASQWLNLADMARRTIDLARHVGCPTRGNSPDRHLTN